MDFWFTAWLSLVFAAAVQSALLALQTFEHRRFARSRLAKPLTEPMSARVALVAPCKGFDLELEQNLRPLLEQDYLNYEAIFVVESADDPACDTIRRLIDQRGSDRARLLVAGRSTDSGQKVHNLLAATADLSPEVEIVAFVDSDARPRRGWLRQLVQRLDRPGAGAATGYRWFIPQRPTVANHFLYSVNAAAAVLVGPGKRRLVWGGSWAIRREVLARCGLRQSWHNTLSDDLVAARVLARTRQRVEYEPACMLASPLDNSLPQAFRFLRRQYTIGRFYTPWIWRLGMAAVVGWTMAFWISAAAAVAGVLRAAPSAWQPVAACAVLWAINAARGYLRRDLARLYFPEHAAAIIAASRIDTWASPLVALVNCTALVSSAFGRRLTWRGITYRLRRGGRVRIIDRDNTPAATSAHAPADLRFDQSAQPSPSHLAPRAAAVQQRKD